MAGKGEGGRGRAIPEADHLPPAASQKVMARLAGGVAHDLNNILLVLQGYTEMAAEEAESSPALQSLLGEMRAATARAAALVRDLLVIGGRGAFTPRPLDLSEIVRRRLSVLQAVCPVGVDIRASLADGLPPVVADEEQLLRILDALCTRSRDSMPAGGVITVTTAPGAEGRGVCLRVTDSGAPLTPDMQQRLFEPYLPGPGGGKGQGLGMPVVEAVAQRLGAPVIVRARESGTDIEIHFPAGGERGVPPAPADRPAPQEAPAAAKAGDHSRAGTTILVAEDDEGLRALAVKVLSREGYTVIAARDGQEAVELFQREIGRIRLVVLDDVMPRLGGLAVHARIHAAAPTVPLILCRGYDWRLTERAVESDGFLRTLPKPWQPRDLVRKVREALEGRP